MSSIKKGAAYILRILVLIISIVAILGIWGVIDVEYILGNMFKTLLVILAATAVIVFIFSIFLRDGNKFEED